MNQSNIDVANQALSMIGNEEISAFDDGSAEAKAVANCYETTVGAALLSPGGAPFRWSFATRQDLLAQLLADPTARWDHAFQIPTLCLRLHAVTKGGYPIAYGIHGDHIVADTAGPLVADYTYRAPENVWPADFLRCVVGELAAQLAMSMNEDKDLAATIAKRIGWQGVRTADSQARSSPRLRASRLTSARHGGHWSRR